MTHPFSRNIEPSIDDAILRLTNEKDSEIQFEICAGKEDSWLLDGLGHTLEEVVRLAQTTEFTVKLWLRPRSFRELAEARE